MKSETTGKILYGVWGFIFGAVFALIYGFAVAGWTTPRETETMNEEAVLASQAAICVAQFIAQPNYEEKLKEIGGLKSWKRSEFIKKGGWDKMPGQENADYAVSQGCADGLEVLIKKLR